MFHTISLKTVRNITGIKKYFLVYEDRKGVNALIFSWYKYEFFLSTYYQLTFFLD